jgi:hypothetical protein
MRIDKKRLKQLARKYKLDYYEGSDYLGLGGKNNGKKINFFLFKDEGTKISIGKNRVWYSESSLSLSQMEALLHRFYSSSYIDVDIVEVLPNVKWESDDIAFDRFMEKVTNAVSSSVKNLILGFVIIVILVCLILFKFTFIKDFIIN